MIYAKVMMLSSQTDNSSISSHQLIYGQQFQFIKSDKSSSNNLHTFWRYNNIKQHGSSSSQENIKI